MRRKLTPEQLAVRDAEWWSMPLEKRLAAVDENTRRGNRRAKLKTLLHCLILIAIALTVTVCSYDPHVHCRSIGYDGSVCYDMRTGQEV